MPRQWLRFISDPQVLRCFTHVLRSIIHLHRCTLNNIITPIVPALNNFYMYTCIEPSRIPSGYVFLNHFWIKAVVSVSEFKQPLRNHFRSDLAGVKRLLIRENARSGVTVMCYVTFNGRGRWPKATALSWCQCQNFYRPLSQFLLKCR